MPRKALDAVVWAATLLALVVGGLVAAIFVVMPTSLGPSELIEAGAEPWSNALFAMGAFVALVVAAVLGLVLWHTQRFRRAGALLVLLEVLVVSWACAKVYNEYF